MCSRFVLGSRRESSHTHSYNCHSHWPCPPGYGPCLLSKYLSNCHYCYTVNFLTKAVPRFLNYVFFYQSSTVPELPHNWPFLILLKRAQSFSGEKLDSFITRAFLEDNQPNNDYCYEIAKKKL